MGCALAGYHAMGSLRLEAGYRHWGHDISDEDTPIEAGLGFVVAGDKPGRLQRPGRAGGAAGPSPQQASHPVPPGAPELLCYHDDPIMRDGEPVGSTTSSMWSYVEDRCLAMGYVSRPGDEGVDQAWLDSGRFEINVGGELVAATPSIRSFYDPRNRESAPRAVDTSPSRTKRFLTLMPSGRRIVV